jgi:hypothetical protein
MDATVIAGVQGFERPVVAAAHRGHEPMIVVVDDGRLCNDGSPTHGGVVLLRASHDLPSSRVRQREDRKL